MSSGMKGFVLCGVVPMVVIALCAYFGVIDALGAFGYLLVWALIMRYFWHGATHRVLLITDSEYRSIIHRLESLEKKVP